MNYRLDDFTIGDGESSINNQDQLGGGVKDEGGNNRRRQFSHSAHVPRRFDTSDYVALLSRVAPGKQGKGTGKKRGSYNKTQPKREPRDTTLLHAMGIERARAADGKMDNTRSRAEKRVLMEEASRLRSEREGERQRTIRLSVEVAQLEWEIAEMESAGSKKTKTQ